MRISGKVSRMSSLVRLRLGRGFGGFSGNDGLNG